MVGWLTVVALLVAAWVGSLALGQARRNAAVRIPDGETPVREARGVPVRVYVSHALPGGTRPNRVNRGRAHLVLTDRRLRVATGLGLVLDAAPGSGGRAACTGPRRLVLETTWARGPQPVQVRVEAILDDPESMARDIQDFLARS